jgi:hypothetical protein
MPNEAKFELIDIVSKLVGPVRPVGSTHVDDERFENLKVLCLLTNQLVAMIDDVAYSAQGHVEFSIKRAGDYASKCLTISIGILE